MTKEKLVLIGASGTIGRSVAGLLENTHDVARVSHRNGDLTVDLTSKASIEALLKDIGPFDALVCTAGASAFGPITDIGDDDLMLGIHHKLMGQVNLVRAALPCLPDNGSITLTSGMLARNPWPGTVPTAMVNAALEGFVRAASLDLESGIRLNAVSPVLVTETAEKAGMGKAGSMTSSQTALAYQAAVQGDMTGMVLDVRDYGTTE